MKKLNLSFYDRNDAVTIAKELLGKLLVTRFDHAITSGRIVETEAYAGVTDKASHAFGGRRTSRTEVMFGHPGHAYVYLCYGIHYLFNVVVDQKEIPQAILIRALEPVQGIPVMLRRTGKKIADHTLTRGPGNVSKALGITTAQTGLSLLGKELFLASDDREPEKENIIATPRIGVDYAGEDAGLLYRFAIKNNPYVSAKQRK
ncbi:MAG: DNA-3-methyladenine glycosylase [Flavitalea sp.]